MDTEGMDFGQMTESLNRATESIQDLDLDLFDREDPLAQSLLLQVRVVAAAYGQITKHLEILMVMGYVAGRLRGRKEAVMAKILGEDDM